MYFLSKKRKMQRRSSSTFLQNNEKLRVWLCFCLFVCDVIGAEKDRGGENQVTNAF